MQIKVDTRDLTRAAAKLNGTGERIQQGWAKLAYGVGAEAVGYIKREFRRGPTGPRTTQIRSNRLRASYSHDVRKATGGRSVELDVGLLRASASASVLGYGRLLEGFNVDGSTFTSKVIRAKGGGWLTFPVYDPNTPGVATGNITGWVRTKQVTFRPRPSFPAARVKFEPRLRAEAKDVLVAEASRAVSS